MKRFCLILLTGLLCNTLAMAQFDNFRQQGQATQEMKSDGLTIAHPNLPMGRAMRVTNTKTGKEVDVTVSGRISASSSRIADLSPRAWSELGLNPGDDIVISSIPVVRTRPPASPPDTIPPAGETRIAQAEPTPSAGAGTHAGEITETSSAGPASGAGGSQQAANQPYNITVNVYTTIPDYASAASAPTSPSSPVASQTAPPPPPQVSQPAYQSPVQVYQVQPPVVMAPPPVYVAPPSPPVVVAPPPVYMPPPPPVYVTPPPPPVVVAPQPSPIVLPPPSAPPSVVIRNVRVVPGYPDPTNGKIYNLQVGSFDAAEGATMTARAVNDAGFRITYEQSGTHYRVIVPGIPASAVYSTVQRLGSLGIEEVWVRVH